MNIQTHFAVIFLTILLKACSPEVEKVIVETYSDGRPGLEQYFEIKGEERVLVRETGYYPEGQKRIEGTYKDGKREGLWRYWYENGNLWSEGYYKADVRHGRSTVWHENGKKYYEGHYTDGERTGKWKFWDEDGKLLKEIDYNK